MGRSNGTATVEKKSLPQSVDPAECLGIKATNVLKVAEKLKQGLSYSALTRLQRRSGLSLEELGAVMQTPPRRLARRKTERRLTPSESERLYRLALVFEKAVNLFEGDVPAARRWLQTPNLALAQQSPLEMTETEVGAREVENLIGRLEHGVLT